MVYGGDVLGLSGRSLFMTKLFNLSYFLGLGALVPFFPVYFRLVGVNAFQTAFFGSVKWMISSWSCSLWVFIAEKIERRKAMLLLSVSLGLVFNFSFVFVGNQKTFDSAIYQCDIKNSSEVKDIVTAVENISNISEDFAHEGNSSRVKINDHNFTKPGESFTNQGLNSSMHENLNETSLRNHSLVTRDVNKEHIFFKRRDFQKDNQTVLIKKDTTWRNSTVWIPSDMFKVNHTSISLLVLVMVGSFISSACPGLIDTVTIDIIQQTMGNYGVYQIIRVTGVALSAILVGLVIDNFKCGMIFSNSFDLHFCLYATISSLAVFAILFIDIRPAKSSRRTMSFYRAMKFICTNFHSLVFVVTLCFIGTVESLVSNFLFWYIMDIGGHVTNMGMVIFLGSLSEVLVHFKAGKITNLIGHNWVLFGTLLSFALRLTYFSYIKNPWLIPLIEIIHGCTKPVMWNACKCYSIIVAPYGLEGTFQSIFTGFYQGLGLGLGGISTGLLYHLYGPVVVFRCTAVLCGVYCLMFAALQCILELPDRNEIDLLDYEQVKQQDSKDQGDWLLEALNADDDVTHYAR